MHQDGTELRVLPATEEMATDIYLCYTEAFPDRPMTLERFSQIYISHLSFDPRLSFIRSEEGVVTGFLLVRPVSEEAVYITLCGVRLSHQRKGIMQELVLGMEKVARDHSFRSFFLDIVNTNFPAIRAFEKLGYHNDGSVLTFRYNDVAAENNLTLLRSMNGPIAGLNPFDGAFIQGMTRFDVYTRDLIGHVVLDKIRKQIVHIEIDSTYRGQGLSRKFISKVVSEMGCKYVFRVQDPGVKSFLLKVGFEIILEQIVFSKS